MILQNTRLLRSTSIYIEEDLTSEERESNKDLRKLMYQFRAERKSVVIKKNKLIVNEKEYAENTVGTITEGNKSVIE